MTISNSFHKNNHSQMKNIIIIDLYTIYMNVDLKDAIVSLRTISRIERIP